MKFKDLMEVLSDDITIGIHNQVDDKTYAGSVKSYREGSEFDDYTVYEIIPLEFKMILEITM